MDDPTHTTRRARLGLALIVLATGIGTALVSQTVDNILIRWGAPNNILEWWDDGIVAILAMTITLGAMLAFARARRAECARLIVIREVYHHVGNALQLLLLREAISDDPTLKATITEAVDRIQWTIDEVLPTVNQPHPDSVEATPSDAHTPRPGTLTPPPTRPAGESHIR